MKLSNLAGYQPYGLRGISKNGTIFLLDVNSSIGGKLEKRGMQTFLTEEFKPILRPLSDLTKAIDEGKFCFEEWVDESSCPEELEQYTRCIYEKLSDGSPINLHYLSYRIIKKMYEHHFDIDGLIEAGSAVDINKL
tara:strand:- start:1469 stop:1876 length:408 start_codon:yes stop_codon:yes gene_type:complete